MLEIVENNINDLEFYKIILNQELDKLRLERKDYLVYPSVNSYLQKLKKLKKNNLKEDEIRRLNIEVRDLLSTYIEVQKIKEIDETINYYEENLKRINSLITKNGIVFTEKTEEPKTYSLEEILSHIQKIKQQENMPLIVNEEDLNNYIRNALAKLHELIPYDDEVVGTIFGTEIHENPTDYKVTLQGERNKDHDELTEREQTAFYGEEAYMALGIKKDEEKRRGAKK